MTENAWSPSPNWLPSRPFSLTRSEYLRSQKGARGVISVSSQEAHMPRKPNYKFDRMERERQKAAKKAARLEAKQAKAAEKKGLNPDGTPLDPTAELSTGEEE